jgi:methionyl-tRNA formyltransferase
VTPLRVIVLGTPQFAVPSLRALVAAPEIDVCLVVTQPDRPSGRGRNLTAPPIKLAAAEAHIPLVQPETLRDDVVVNQLRAKRPDALVVIAYGELLRRNVLEMAPLGCVNVHPSLLPKYRGAAPIPAAILAGDDQTGVSIMRLVKRLDAGPILAQQAVDISNDETSGSLSARLADLAATMLPGVLIRYAAGQIDPIPQDEALATYTREWTSADARIDWSQPASSIERLVRAAHPWPVAWTTVRGARFRIHAVRPHDGPAQPVPPGIVNISGSAVSVVTGAGSLELLRVQPAGKAVMAAGDWWRGQRAATLQFGT